SKNFVQLAAAATGVPPAIGGRPTAARANVAAMMNTARRNARREPARPMMCLIPRMLAAADLGHGLDGRGSGPNPTQIGADPCIGRLTYANCGRSARGRR